MYLDLRTQLHVQQMSMYYSNAMQHYLKLRASLQWRRSMCVLLILCSLRWHLHWHTYGFVLMWKFSHQSPSPLKLKMQNKAFHWTITHYDAFFWFSFCSVLWTVSHYRRKTWIIRLLWSRKQDEEALSKKRSNSRFFTKWQNCSFLIFNCTITQLDPALQHCI